MPLKLVILPNPIVLLPGLNNHPVVVVVFVVDPKTNSDTYFSRLLCLGCLIWCQEWRQEVCQIVFITLKNSCIIIHKLVQKYHIEYTTKSGFYLYFMQVNR